MSKKRYQECSLLEKIYRRVKYQPFYFIKALFVSNIYRIRYILKKDEYTLGARLIFRVTFAEWSRKANYYYTIEELQDKLWSGLYDSDRIPN